MFPAGTRGDSRGDSGCDAATESEIETQDREGMNTVFLVQGDSVTTGALTFYDKGSNVMMI